MSRAMSASAAISSARRRASRRSRAFWIAMPTLAAIVASRRASDGPNRPSASTLCTLITPIAPSLTRIGTPRYDLTGVPTPRFPNASKSSSRLSSSGSRVRRMCDVRP